MQMCVYVSVLFEKSLEFLFYYYYICNVCMYVEELKIYIQKFRSQTCEVNFEIMMRQNFQIRIFLKRLLHAAMLEPT